MTAEVDGFDVSIEPYRAELLAFCYRYGVFMEWVFEHAGRDWVLRAVAAHGQAGFAAYRRDGEAYALHTPRTRRRS